MFVAAKVGAGGTAVALAGLAAFLGHVFPFTLRFRGGKGVATALGVLLGFSASLAGIAAAIWLAVAAVTRYSSLAALAAAMAAPFLAWRMLDRPEATSAVAAMCLVLVWRHRGNIRKLLAGNESRIGVRRNDPDGSV